MRLITLFPIALLALAACVGVQPTDHETWSKQPTPYYWDTHSLWSFIELGEDGEVQRSMALRFSDKSVETCRSGDWRLVEILSQKPQRHPSFLGEPAYQLSGRSLVIDLTSNICDNAALYRGLLTAMGFVGEIAFSHMLGEEVYGPVYGVRWNWSGDAEK